MLHDDRPAPGVSKPTISGYGQLSDGLPLIPLGKAEYQGSTQVAAEPLTQSCVETITSVRTESADEVPSAIGTGVPVSDPPGPPSIADHYRDLLELLNNRKRLGMVARLSVGFYEGWRPKRAEVADLIAVEVGILTADEAYERIRQRRRGVLVRDITPIVLGSRRASSYADRRWP